MHRFFISEKLDEVRKVLLPKQIRHQIQNVLRLKRGERFVLFDGWDYDFISELENNGEANIIEKVLNRREPERKIFLFQALLKKDKMELVFQNGTEIGVFEFIPILSKRSVKKDFNKERAKKVVIEAAEQSGRALVPAVKPVMSFKHALEFVQTERLFGVISDPNSKRHISEVLKNAKTALFVGPEGGFTSEEVNEARECGFNAVNLGRLTLRAETAAIVASSFLV